MADEQFSVIFAGQMVDGADPERVKQNLANLFNTTTERIEAMFSGKPVVIKKGLIRRHADNYQAVLKKAGAIVHISGGGAGNTPAPEESEPPAEQPTTASATPSAPTSTGREPPPAALRGTPEAADLTIADVGATLVEHQQITAPDFDTTQFDLAEVGVDLVDPVPVTPPDFDLSSLSLDPVGADLSEPRNIPPADFDTSGLSLADDQN